MLLRLRNRHFFLFDILLLTLTPILALSLRVNLPWERQYGPALATFTLLALLIKLLVFYFFRLYARFWRYASIDELVSITLGVLTASVMSASIFFSIQGIGLIGAVGLPLSVPFIDGLLTLFVVSGTRFCVRAIEYRRHRNRVGDQGKRVLIVGAGDAGKMVAQEIHSSDRVSSELVGFVDDDPRKIGILIQGVSVLGPIAKIRALIDQYHVQEVILAMPTAPGHVIRNILNACEEADVPSKTLPGIYELLSGQVSVNRLREIKIDDLLRREPVKIDIEQVKEMITGKRVLITGAGGSIGSELCRQIIRCQPVKLITLGHGENSVFTLSNELSKFAASENNEYFLSLETVIADVRDRSRLDAIFRRYRPEIIFHAAAHKHVPLMECNVEDAVTNNVLGTQNLVNLSKHYGVDRFVLISTDKAVNPISVMGMTKHVAELIVARASKATEHPYISVRFGNVLGSRGSVVTQFQYQIERGGPVTVTHPDMQRYFMTISEAVLLVLQASALGHNGEMFVLNMGEPVKIVDLAIDMIELSGCRVGHDIEIVYTGMRPGERMTEVLFADHEEVVRTEHDKIFVTDNGARHLPDQFSQEIEELIRLAQDGETEAVRRKLRSIVSMPVFLNV